MDSILVVGFDSMVDSFINSLSESEVAPNSEFGSTNNFGFVSDFDYATSSDSTTEECSRTSTLRLVVVSSQNYDKLWCSMYMNTPSVGNLFVNV